MRGRGQRSLGDGFLRPSVQITPLLATTTLGDPSYGWRAQSPYIGGNDGRVYAVTTPGRLARTALGASRGFVVKVIYGLAASLLML